MKRNATAVWHGTGKEGNGHLTTQSTTLDHTQYSFLSRFENGIGTNPEELVAAAHAGCFTMKLSFILNAAGFTADTLETKCDIELLDGTITSSHLTVKGIVPNIDKEKFDEAVAEAKANCLISKLFNTNISVEAQLS